MSRKDSRSRSTFFTPPTRRPSARTLRAAAVAVTAAACVAAYAAPASADGTEPVVSRGTTIPAFYNPPAQLPAANGELIRTEPLPLGLSLPGLDGRPMPGTATRLMYRTTDSNGQPAAVTGAYIEPSAAWKGGGARPLVALASGTMGQGDQCAPSLALQHPLALTPESVSIGYETLSVYRLLSAGVAVVVTDYVGLGTTDRLHTYVNRVDEGHALLDAVRAAHRLPATSLTTDSRTGLYGYSQGGGASASAAELQPSYAPEIQLAGTYAGAPPADLTATMKGIDGSALAGALAWSINGFAQADADLRDVVEANINDAGRAALKDASTMCVGDAILGYGFAKSSKWTTTGKSLGEIIAAEPKAQAALDRQRIGTLKPTGPVRVATGIQDDIVPHAQARQLAVDWCRKGGNVTYDAVILPNLGNKILTNHMVPLITDQGDAISWMTNRLAGKRATSNCWSMPIQP
ncbi:MULTISPECIES: lipase family protein [unclassified Streptomyces]|uniref:lipase family protein n=1 Tax=unclassified Streptomyces TaxID=2593676 RepID=UPI002E2C5BA6|nr:lipase family protein [Streptomyces sp. NBC_01423]WSX93836.1 lipase family protein [Streptomyces sp. NBC_00891]WSY08314.1 lipase family protein [Streptomyces sp. NBC_00890]WSZ09937.1 lipase family protein [Streptomyces sp. NBC_00869]WSZ22560.1 lipase family protein [Streptomyces sp. NBC_00870]